MNVVVVGSLAYLGSESLLSMLGNINYIGFTVMGLFWKTRNKITLVLLLLLLQDLLGCGHWAVHDGGPVVGLRLERVWRALLMLQVLFLLLRLKFIRDGRTVVMSTQVS